LSEVVKVKIYDEQYREVSEIPVKDIEDQLGKIKEILRKCLAKLKDVHDDYELGKFEVGLSLRAGFFVISAEGSITLTYEKRNIDSVLNDLSSTQYTMR